MLSLVQGVPITLDTKGPGTRCSLDDPCFLLFETTYLFVEAGAKQVLDPAPSSGRVDTQ